eukprot:5676443-Amphidinium_carterae.1
MPFDHELGRGIVVVGGFIGDFKKKMAAEKAVKADNFEYVLEEQGSRFEAQSAFNVRARLTTLNCICTRVLAYGEHGGQVKHISVLS